MVGPFVHPSSQLHFPTNAGTLLYHLPGALRSTLHPPPQRFPATAYGFPLLTPRSPLPISSASASASFASVLAFSLLRFPCFRVSFPNDKEVYEDWEGDGLFLGFIIR
ncbi:hypothetical protein D9758_018786 [Tetrapyrgos nigripes]|uniref:Uncharacterized protein n=1 Tax=Tetrapyrgos nigripes TaxID=182062 RepID=A0A8H5B6J5_9AGAR|nr:hypothetical protein D9758_018786 [Tetrapyrgos nigripes]